MPDTHQNEYPPRYHSHRHGNAHHRHQNSTAIASPLVSSQLSAVAHTTKTPLVLTDAVHLKDMSLAKMVREYPRPKLQV